MIIDIKKTFPCNFTNFFLYGKSAKAYLRIGCTYCRSGRWTTPNKSLDVEGQTVNEHIQANHTIKHFVELIPPHFATTYRDSIQPYVVSLFCLFAHPNHFLQVSIQIYLGDQKPKVLEKKKEKVENFILENSAHSSEIQRFMLDEITW